MKKLSDGNQHINPVSVIVSGVLLSLALFYAIYLWQIHENAEQIESQFRKDALKHVSAVRTSLIIHEKVANTLGAFLRHSHSNQITREEFNIFAGSLSQTSPSMQALVWIPKVSLAERSEYEERAAKTIPGFHFTELDENSSLIKASLRDEYYPAYFVEPYVGNELALGFDLASETIRRGTMNLARDSGQIAMSGLVTLVQEREKQKNALLTFLPIYQLGARPVNRAQRRLLLKGFVLAVCRIGNMFEQAITELDIPGIDVWVYGTPVGSQEQLMYANTNKSPGTPARHLPSGSLRHDQTIDMGGYQWRVTAAPALTSSSPIQPDSYIVWQLLFIGVFMTGIIAWYLRKLRKYTFNLLKSNRSLDQAIGRLRSNETTLKTSEDKLKTALQVTELEQSRLKDAIESLDDALAIYDSDERLVACNQNYRKIYHEVAHMILPGALYREMLEVYFRVTNIGSVTGKTIDEWVGERLTNHRQHHRNQVQELDGRWIQINDYPTSEGGVVSLCSDITSLKNRDIIIHALNRTHAVLSRSSCSLAQAVDEKSLLSAFCDNVVEIGGYSLSTVFFILPDGGATLTLMAKSDGVAKESAVSSVTQQNRDYSDPHASEIAINTQQTLVVGNLKKPLHPDSWKNQGIHQGYQSMIALPLKVYEEVIGCFNIYSIEKEAFNKEEIVLLEELGQILSQGIETMRKRAAREQKMLQFKNEVEHNERKRIAATLHDGPAQTMQAIKLGLNSVDTGIGNEQQATRELLNRITSNVGNVIEELRGISHDLRPILLERMGLEEAIRHYCAELSQHSNTKIHISNLYQNFQLHEVNKEQCFLSFREAMNNAVRHAEATRIEVCMEIVDPDMLSLQIRDNGVGFNTDDKFRLPSGLGLSMISERMQSIGGHAEIYSSPESGTTVTLITPVKS